jgi:hypothetical protein
VSYARRVDTTQPEIVKDLRCAGFSVALLFRVGDDVPDLIIGRNGRDRMVETKTGKKKLSEGQAKFAREWKGAPPIRAICVEDVLQAWGAIG